MEKGKPWQEAAQATHRRGQRLPKLAGVSRDLLCLRFPLVSPWPWFSCFIARKGMAAEQKVDITRITHRLRQPRRQLSPWMNNIDLEVSLYEEIDQLRRVEAHLDHH